MRIIFYILATWGVGLLVPLLAVFCIRTIWQQSGWGVALPVGLLCFVAFIIFGEWWSRLVNRIVYGSDEDEVPPQENKK